MALFASVCLSLPHRIAARLVLLAVVAAQLGAAQELDFVEMPASGPAANALPKPPDAGLDLYGDPLPIGAIARLGTVRYRHPGWHKRVAFLPDNETFITGTEDNSIRVWNARTGSLLHEFDFEGRRLKAFCLAPDGRTIATFAYMLDSETREYQMWLSFWRAPLWRERGRREWTEQFGGQAPTNLTYSPDGEHLLAGAENGSIRVWSAATGDEVMRRDLSATLRGGVDAVAFSPRDDLVALATQQGVWTWEFLSEKDPVSFAASSRGARALEFTSDGRRLAVGCDGDGPARIYDVATRQELVRLNGKAEYYYPAGLCFSLDDKQLYVPGYRTDVIECYDVESGRLLQSLEAPGAEPGDMALSADGRFLAASGGRCQIVAWDLETGERLSDRFVGHAESPYELAFTPGGAHVVSAGIDGTIRIWDPTTGRQVRLLAHDHWVSALAISPRGDRIASCGLDDTVRLWAADTGKQLFKYGGHGRTGGNSTMEVAFFPDGERFLSCGTDGFVRIYSTRTGKILEEKPILRKGEKLQVDELGQPLGAAAAADPFGPGDFGIQEPTFTPDATQLLIGGRIDGAIRIHDAATGQKVDQAVAESPLIGYGLSPDGKVLATLEQSPLQGDDAQARWNRKCTLRVRDWASKKILREAALPGMCHSEIAFAPDGALMAFSIYAYADATYTTRERWLSVVDGNTLEEVARIEDAANAPTHMAFSPDGTRLAASQQDSSILIWDLTRVGLEERAP
jgi:WD40 repeat protein